MSNNHNRLISSQITNNVKRSGAFCEEKGRFSSQKAALLASKSGISFEEEFQL